MGQIGQIGCPIDYTQALEDRVVPCRIALGRVVSTTIGAIRGRH